MPGGIIESEPIFTKAILQLFTMHTIQRPVAGVFCVLILISSACNRQKKHVVGVVPKGSNHIFWQTVHAGAIKAARESGLEVDWNAPALEIDASRQIEIV